MFVRIISLTQAGTIIETNDKKLMDAGIPYLSTPGLSAKQEVRKLVRSLRMQYIRVLDELLKSPEGAFFGMGVMDNVSLGIKNIDIIVSNLYHHLDQLRNLDAQRQLKEHIQQTTAEREEMMREVGRLQAGGLREMLLRRR